MKHDELITELGEALFQADRGEDAKKLYYPKVHYENMARIAISTVLESLQEPTREMWEKGGNAVVKVGHVHHDKITDTVWTAMLNASPLRSATDETR